MLLLSGRTTIVQRLPSLACPRKVQVTPRSVERYTEASPKFPAKIVSGCCGSYSTLSPSIPNEGITFVQLNPPFEDRINPLKKATHRITFVSLGRTRISRV